MHEAIRYPGYHGKIGRILIHHWLEPVRNENPAPDKPDCRWVYMQLNSTTVSLVEAPVILVGLRDRRRLLLPTMSRQAQRAEGSCRCVQLATVSSG